MTDPVEHLNTTEARAGTRTRSTRNVLVISLVAIVLLLAALLFVMR